MKAKLKIGVASVVVAAATAVGVGVAAQEKLHHLPANWSADAFHGFHIHANNAGAERLRGQLH